MTLKSNSVQILQDALDKFDPNCIDTDATTVMNAYVGAEALQGLCHSLAAGSGWWEDAPTGVELKKVINKPLNSLDRLLGGALVAQKLTLIHSEVSEAMEGARKNLMDDKLPDRKMLEVELGDAIIRIFDLAGALNLDLAGAIIDKLAYNQERPDHKKEARQAEGGKAY